MQGGEETETGLSTREAARRLRQFGPNELPSPERRSIFGIALNVVRQPMFALLLSGGIIYLLLGEALDAAVLALFATLSVTIGIVQEGRSERVLESLRSLASPRALVIRDGRRSRIAGRELVPGDITILGEGDRVPADALLLSGDDLLADESLLTGESVPVRKKPDPGRATPAAPGGEDLPFVFAGTLIARGAGVARVIATGSGTEMGKIGQALKSIVMEQPRLQKQLAWLVRDFAMAGLAVTGLVVLVLGFTRGSWLQAALGGIALGMSVLPEEIPLVLAVFMAMGARRIARAGVLTRRAAALETLGSATVLCTDKTGTLTENRMRLTVMAADEMVWRLADRVDHRINDLLGAALAASAPLPVDPMDRAIHETALELSAAPPRHLLKAHGMRPDFPAIVQIWEDADGRIAAYAKGAPETVADLCALAPEERRRLLALADQFAGEGMRLLAVAVAVLAPKQDAMAVAARELPYTWLGLVGFTDPLRATVPAAVQECREAGVRVVMITGDYPATARAIARQAGIETSALLTGEKLEAMSDAALRDAVGNVTVFARVRPQQKLRLVEAFKAGGEIVAMTGDGVNDAPAIKAADIGIAMGARGTDVAREASALVLLGDDFASIVAAIRLGRRIYDNLRKAIAYIVAVHVPVAGLALLPLLFGLPLMLMPIHIALLEMVIDPACSIVFEAEREERDVMRRPPRPPGEPVLPRRAALWAMLQGFAALALLMLALALGLWMKLDAPSLRALLFTLLVLSNIGLILVNRGTSASVYEVLSRANPSFWILTGAVLSVLAVALFWTPARALFQFQVLNGWAVAAALGAGLALIVLLEAAKARFGMASPGNTR